MKACYEKYFRDNLPHIWCAGCGNGIVMGAWARAMDEMGLENNDCVGISGIGCSSRITSYIDLYTLHTAHGRALPFAIGVKMCKPDMHVFVFSGDGDCAAIGGNHFIHACRRNIDMTLIVINNSIYGMTGGQYSPLTPTGHFATTAPYGNIDPAFDICKIAEASGATFVARSDIYNVRQLIDLIKEGHDHKGFSLIEVISGCPISYGRRNKINGAPALLRYIKEHSIPVAIASKMGAEEMKGKWPNGVLYKTEAKEYVEAYQELVTKVQGGS